MRISLPAINCSRTLLLINCLLLLALCFISGCGNGDAMSQSDSVKGLFSRIEYNPEAETLALEFRSGDYYQYSKIPAAVYQELTNAPSPGSYYNHHIKGRYPSNND